MTQSVTVKNITAGYAQTTVLKNFNLDIRAGELLAILGPSGCGKSTLLNLLGGFLTPGSGTIMIGERDVTGLPPQGRNISMVFQSYALFPHLTVAENVAYGLKVRRIAKGEIARRVEEALASVGLAGFRERYPRQLSGGQQQRVSLARAMVIEPQVLLLDEPLSNLDAKLRREMRVEIKELQRRIRTTTVLVTHDQEEALTMADRVAVMHRGKIEQLGSPTEIYKKPASHFVAEFVGRTNSFPGRIAASDQRVFEAEAGIRLERATSTKVPDGGLIAIVRPENVSVSGLEPAVPNGHVGTVTYIGFAGTTWEASVELAPNVVVTAFLQPGAWVPEEGARVNVSWKPEDVTFVRQEAN